MALNMRGDNQQDGDVCSLLTMTKQSIKRLVMCENSSASYRDTTEEEQ